MSFSRYSAHSWKGRSSSGSGAGRGLLLIAQAEGGQDASDEGGGPAADVSVRDQQQLVQKVQGLLLLGGVPVGEILLKNGDVCLEPGGVLFAPGGLQSVAEELLMAQPVHQADIVVHGGTPQSGHHLVRVQQGNIFGRAGGAAGGAEGGVHPKGDEIVLKVPQLGVDIAVAQALGIVHIVQLAEDDVKGLLQGVEAGDLPAVLPIGLLHPEVRVHQRQGLRGQVLNLQIPDGVVGRDVAQGRQSPAGEPLVGVVIVQVGHPFPGLAAEFAQVVAQGGSGDQPQVDESAGGAEGPGHPHGHIVDAGDVLQGAEGCDLPAQAEHLIDVFLPEPVAEAAVLLRHTAVGEFLLRAEFKVQPEVKGQAGPLRVKQDLEQLQKAQRSIPLGGGMSGVRRRIQQRPGHLVGVGQPSLSGIRRHLVQQGAEGRQGVGAGDPAPDGHQIPKQLVPVGAAEDTLRVGAGHSQLLKKRGRFKGLRRLNMQGLSQLSFHGYRLPFPLVSFFSVYRICGPEGREISGAVSKKRSPPRWAETAETLTA